MFDWVRYSVGEGTFKLGSIESVWEGFKGLPYDGSDIVRPCKHY